MTTDQLKAASLALASLALVVASVHLLRKAAPEDRLWALLCILVFGWLQLFNTYVMAFPCGETGLPMSERYQTECDW